MELIQTRISKKEIRRRAFCVDGAYRLKSEVSSWPRQCGIEKPTQAEQAGVGRRGIMESGAAQMALPVLGIAAVAAVTFYAVSFLEMREKSFKELDEREENESSSGGFRSSASSRERRARRKAEREARK